MHLHQMQHTDSHNRNTNKATITKAIRRNGNSHRRLLDGIGETISSPRQ